MYLFISVVAARSLQFRSLSFSAVPISVVLCSSDLCRSLPFSALLVVMLSFSHLKNVYPKLLISRDSRVSRNGRIKTATWIETHSWRLGEKIGSGAFGEVFQGLNDKVRMLGVSKRCVYCAFCVTVPWSVNIAIGRVVFRGSVHDNMICSSPYHASLSTPLSPHLTGHAVRREAHEHDLRAGGGGQSPAGDPADARLVAPAHRRLPGGLGRRRPGQPVHLSGVGARRLRGPPAHAVRAF